MSDDVLAMRQSMKATLVERPNKGLRSDKPQVQQVVQYCCHAHDATPVHHARSGSEQLRAPRLNCFSIMHHNQKVTHDDDRSRDDRREMLLGMFIADLD
jgi:hypothetical protein